MSAMTVVGVISDTHGLLRPEAVAALQGCGLILHAGDIGAPEVLEALRRLAPVHAIRGNIDEGSEWAADIPPTRELDIEGRRVYMLHDLNRLDIDPRDAGIDIVISGHSHAPHINEDGGLLHINPGSAGPRRFSLPVSVALLEITADGIDARIVQLDVPRRDGGRRRNEHYPRQ